MTDSDTSDDLLPEDLEAYDEVEDQPQGNRTDQLTRTTNIPSSSALNTIGAARLQSERPSSTIVLLGPPAAGKSTLLASAFEAMSRGINLPFAFAGSRTIQGFERLCFHSRASSGGEYDDTERTDQGEPQFLHLDLAALHDGSRSRFIFPDLSGEEFNDLVRRGRSVVYEPLFPVAQHLTFVLDGAAAVDLSRRNIARQALQTAIRVMKENSLVHERAMTELVVSKNDLVQGADPELRSWAISAAESLAASLPGKRAEQPIFAAVRPMGDSAAAGISELLNRWAVSVPSSSRPFASEDGRSFDRFLA